VRGDVDLPPAGPAGVRTPTEGTRQGGNDAGRSRSSARRTPPHRL